MPQPVNPRRYIVFALPLMLLCVCSSAGRADVLAEVLFWNEMSKQIGRALRSIEDYKRERRLWRSKIAAAKAELKRCGGCASAQAELDKWQGIENKFQDMAGSMAQAVGMPPVIAKWLNIDVPLARGYTRAEWEKMKEVHRPAWYADRPQFCQNAVDSHLACQREVRQGSYIGWDAANRIGGRCYETRKLWDHCYRKDYAAFEREKQLEAARASGYIIPEYREHWGTTVYYGLVPDTFIPDFPPVEVARATLNKKSNEKGVSKLRYIFYKEGKGLLSGFFVSHFDHNLIAPENKCQSVDRNPNDEIARRVCDDFLELKYAYKSPILVCVYTRKGGIHEQRGDGFFYWYATRPETVDPKYLLKRSHTHPLLRLNEPKTDCPATKADAEALEASYMASLQSLRSEVPQVSARERIPRPERQKRYFDERQAKYQAQFKRIQDTRAAMTSFPLEGRYQFRVMVNNTAHSGECTMVRQMKMFDYFIACTENGRRITAKAVNAGGYLQLRWLDSPWATAHRANYTYAVDLARRESGRGDALVAKTSDGSVQGHFVRIGDLTKITAFPISGTYNFQLSADGVTRTGLCTIERDKRYREPRFSFVCRTEEGDRYESQGILPSGEAAALWFVGWYPGHFQVNGRSVTGLHFEIPPHRDTKLTNTVLIAYADNGVTGRLEKTDPAAAALRFGMELEALPELKRGKYASWARSKGINSLEQLAALSDKDAQAIGMGWVWRRDLAREFLKNRGRDRAVTMAQPAHTASVDQSGANKRSVEVGPDTPHSQQVLENYVETKRKKREAYREQLRKQREAYIRKQREAYIGAQQARRNPRVASNTADSKVHTASAVCTVESIAGTYKSQLGPIVCKPEGKQLNCCFGGSCRKVLRLAFHQESYRLIGEWAYASGTKGPAEFRVTKSCDLSDGRWGYDSNKPPRSRWHVAGRR